ncbi:MAG: translation initiation factor IF-3 [Balneolales bacterium]
MNQKGEATIGKRFKTTFPRRSEPKERVNESIRAETVRVIKPDNEHVILPVEEAIELAYSLELDLVEVAPNADPPVCKIMNHGKYLFEKKKKEKDAKKKQHVVLIKELRFRPQTDDHDYNFKKRHAEGFLKDGNKVKATVQFKGRDIIYSDQGRNLLDRLAEDLEDFGKIETPAKLEGKRMSMILTPAKGSGSS